MNKKKKQLLVGVLNGGIIMAAALVLKYVTSIGFIDSENSRRAMQVIIGVFLIATGNLIPKTLEPLSNGCGAPSKEQSFKRFAGWTFVIAGLAYSIVWLVTPLEFASIVSMSVVIAAILLVAPPFVWSVIKCRRAQRITRFEKHG